VLNTLRISNNSPSQGAALSEAHINSEYIPYSTWNACRASGI